jgi:hypothetical protein
MNATNPDFNNRLDFSQNPQITKTQENTLNTKGVRPLENNYSTQVQPPLVADKFVGQAFQSKQKQSIKPKEKTPFNPWKWMILTPLIVGATTIVGLPLIGMGVFRHWFLQKPSNLSKVIKPDDLQRMFKQMQEGKPIRIPEEFKVPVFKEGDKLGNLKAFLNMLRSLPIENKKKILQYLMSFKGLKESFGLTKDISAIIVAAGTGNIKQVEKILKGINLNPIHQIFERGGTVTKKAGQSIADALKGLLTASEALKSIEASGLTTWSPEQKKSIERFKNWVPFVQKMYNTFASMQSKPVQLEGKTKLHYEDLYGHALKAFKAQNPSSPLVEVKFDDLELLEASTAIVGLDHKNSKAFKFQRPDALANRAADNLDFLGQVNYLIQISLNETLGKLNGGGAKLTPKQMREKAFKAGVNSAHDILQGSHFDNESLGLNRIEEAARWIGADPKYNPPKPYLSQNFKSKYNNDEYGVVIMDKISGQNLADLYQKYLAGDQEAKKTYERFMTEHAHNVLLRQASNAVSTDAHSGNIFNNGKVIDVAEHRYVPIQAMNDFAGLVIETLRGVKRTYRQAITDMDSGVTRYQVIPIEFDEKAHQALRKLLVPNELKKLADQRKLSEKAMETLVLAKLFEEPLEVFDVLYNTLDLGSALKVIPDSVGLNKQAVSRATEKFGTFASSLSQFKAGLKGQNTPLAQQFLASEGKMVEDFVEAYSKNAGISLTQAERSQMIKHIQENMYPRVDSLLD